MKRILPHDKKYSHCQVEKEDLTHVEATTIREFSLAPTLEQMHSLQGRQFTPCYFNLITSVFTDTRHSIMSLQGSVRKQGEPASKADTANFGLRQLTLSVDVCC